jgi:type I restriction enzyme, S subunit
MLNWKDYKLGDITDWFSGGTPSKENANYWQGSIPWISAKSMTWHKVSSSDLNISDEGLRNGTRLANVNDILLLVRGSGLFNDIPICLVEKPVTFNQDIKAIRAKDFKYQDFIYYWLHGNKKGLYEILEETGIGAGKFDTELLKNLDISIPVVDSEREVVTTIARSIFDKIDLLNRQNATLETMAEMLFRQWFVEEAKEDWNVKPLGSLVTVKRGGSPRPIQDYLSDTGLRWLKISDATKENSPYIFEIKEYIKIEGLSKTTQLKAGTLVLSNSATPGIPKILQVDTCIHDGWLHFPKSIFSNEFLYLLFKSIRPELLQLGNGSIFTNLKTDILKEYQLTIPDSKSLLEFDNLVKPIFNKLYSNTVQTRTLVSLRDTLLPKLMSGKVRVIEQ